LISLGASSTDPDADPLAYAWDFGDATTGSGEAPAHVWNDNGMYSVRVIVSDGQLADTAFTTVTVSNASPSGSLVAPTGSLAQDAPFLVGIGSPTDPSTVDQVSLTFRFNCGSGFGEWGTTPNVTCTARGEPGKYNVVAAVRDKDGASVSYSRQVTVVNDAPIVTPTSTGVITVARGTPVAVSATFTDRAGDSPWTARVLWGKGQGNSNVGMVTPGIPFGAVNVYPKAGTYTVTLEVRDVHNAPGSSFITVIVQ
jgi:PKD repeat protein